jgi:hypothetical protein
MKTDVAVLVRRNLWAARSEHQGSSRQCLTELIESFAPDLAEVAWQINVAVSDWLVPPQLWDRIRPKPGQIVSIAIKPPKGAGPLSTGNLFADIGLGVLFFPYGVSLLATAGFGLLSPEPTSSPTAGKQSYTITGTRNEMAQVGQPIPFVAGRWAKVFPLHIAQAYAAWEGETQYLHALLSPGWGPVKIENLKIGDVPFAEFPGLTYQVREGRDNDTAVSLYPRVVHEALGEPHGQPIQVTNKDGPFRAQVGDPDVTMLEFELTWPQGLFRFGESSGKRHPMTVQVKLEYRALPSGSWTTLVQGSVTAETQNSLRRSWSVAVSANPAGWEGQVTRITADIDESRIQSDFYWTSFRGRTQDEPVHQLGLAKIAIKVPASQNAQGMLDQISCTCTRYAPNWNGSSWVEAASANPATVYRSIAQHARANRGEFFPDSRLDLPALQAWHVRCAAAGRTFGQVFSDDGTMLDRLRLVASAGRASYSTIDGKLSIVEDIERTQYVQAITPHNSSGFVKRQSFRRLPHAVRVGFYDEAKECTRQEITVYADGYNGATATIFDDLDLTQRGITLSQRAWEEGRFFLAEQYYRRWTASQEMDLEHITARRGELVSFMHPAALLGIASGRIKATTISGSNTTSIAIEGAVTMEVGHSYGVRIRSTAADGSLQLVQIALATIAGRRSALTFQSPLPLATLNVAAGDLYQYGETSKVAVDCIIKSITPSGPRTATVEVMPHAQPQINNSISGAMDPYDPQITIPQGQGKPPPKPSIIAIRRGDLTVPGDPYPVRMVHLVAVLSSPPAKATSAGWFDARYRVQGTEDWTGAAATMAGLQVGFLVPWGAIYEVEVRAGATSAGMPLASDWSNPVTVDCQTTPATIVDTANVTGLQLFGQGNDHDFTGRDPHFVWRMTGWAGAVEVGEEPDDGDVTFLDPTFSHWRIEIYSGDDLNELRREERVTAPDYVYGFDKNWSDAERIAPDDPASALARQLTVQVLVVDTYGRQSPAPARLTVQNPAPPQPAGLSVTTNIGTIWVSFDAPSDPDWIGMKVWADKTNPSFVPNDAVNLLGKVNANIASFTEFQADHGPVQSGTNYYVKVAAYDAFGDDPNLLNISGSLQVTTGSVDIADLPQFTFDNGPTYTVNTSAEPDILSWTGATAHVVHPVAGTTATYTIAAGSVTWGGLSIYLSYQEQATVLEASTDPAHHTTSDRVLMAIWHGGLDVSEFNGKAGIDGSLIYAQTITGNALAVGQAIITQQAQIASAIVTNAKITDLDASKLIAGSIITKLLYVSAAAGGRIEIDGSANRIRVLDAQATPVVRALIGKLGTTATDWGITLFGANGVAFLDASGLDGTFIHDLTVDSIKIKDGAVSGQVLATGGSLSGLDANEVNFLTAVFPGAIAGKPIKVQLSAVYNVGSAATPAVGTARIYRNNVLVKSFSAVGVGLNNTFSAIFVDASPPAGSITYRWTWSGSAAANLSASAGVYHIEQIIK